MWLSIALAAWFLLYQLAPLDQISPGGTSHDGVLIRLRQRYTHHVNDNANNRLYMALRENITVELRQDKIEGDPEWRATVVRCIAECMRE